MFKVDIFVAGERPFNQQQISRRQLQILAPPNETAYVLAHSRYGRRRLTDHLKIGR